MKTAVEWLIDELYKQGISLYTPELIEQAKEMEKEQMIDARVNAPLLNTGSKYDYVIEAEKYYKETFKQQEQ